MEKREIDAKFGRLLAEVRRRKEFSQKQLGDALELSRASIANIESGKHGVQLSFVFRAARILGVAPDELIPQIESNLDGATLEEQRFLKAAQQIVSRS